MKIYKLIKTMDEVFTNDTGLSKWQKQVGCNCFRELRYIKGYFITRCFSVSDRIIEYSRFIISKNSYSILVSNIYQHREVNTLVKHTRWIYYTDIVKADCDYYHGPVSYTKLSEDIKGTVYDGCLFNEIIGTENLGDMNYLLKNALLCPKVFIKLVENKLYNLTVDADMFSYNDDILVMLGVPNDYLCFIVKHNLYYEELQTLKKIKRKNFRIIHKFNKYSR